METDHFTGAVYQRSLHDQRGGELVLVLSFYYFPPAFRISHNAATLLRKDLEYVQGSAIQNQSEG